ncbi:MAG TPA: hypothetical protein VE973_02495, partial [Candidatus Limnocylindria bacterium]|nr:hypothetical protein [Candidatus Limnocylindria bacterium]
TSEPSGQTVSLNSSTTVDVSPKGGTFSSGDGSPDGGADIQVVEINYDGTSFKPASVNIKSGDYVVFKNIGSVDMWPASNPHPSHTDYLGFDAKKPMGFGEKYKFQFTKVGNWGFHNHLNPSQGGVINVSQ